MVEGLKRSTEGIGFSRLTSKLLEQKWATRRLYNNIKILTDVLKARNSPDSYKTSTC